MRRSVIRGRFAWLWALLGSVFIVGGAAAALKVGSAAPDFTAKDLNNKTVKLSGFRGKPVLLYFWTTW